jgi:hypothetical protein
MRTNGHLVFLFPPLESHNSNGASHRIRAGFVSQTMRTTFAAISLLALSFGFVGPKVSAQTIVPISQTRSISAFSSSLSGSTNPSVSAADFGVFNSQITLANSSASQNSMIDTATITASGAAHGTFNPPQHRFERLRFQCHLHPCLSVPVHVERIDADDLRPELPHSSGC